MPRATTSSLIIVQIAGLHAEVSLWYRYYLLLYQAAENCRVQRMKRFLASIPQTSISPIVNPWFVLFVHVHKAVQNNLAFGP